MFRLFTENRMVFMTGESTPRTPTAPDAQAEAAPVEPNPEQQFAEGKAKFETSVANAQSTVEDLRTLYKESSDANKLFADLDTQLKQLTTEFSTKEAEIQTKSQESLKKLEAQLYADVLKVLEGETTDNLDSKIKEKTADTLKVDVSKVDADLNVLEQKRVEAASHIPPYQKETATALLDAKEAGVNFDAKRVLDESGKNFSITTAEGYQIHMSVKRGVPNAKLVEDYSDARFSQEFADQAAFSKFYKNIKPADLPQAGQGAKGILDVSNLPAGKPPPFGGAKRTRELSVSVGKDGKIKVDVLSIRFGEPPKPTVEIDLGKPFDEVKTVEDILYPPGYGKGNGGKSGKSAESQDTAATMPLESGEKTLDDYISMLEKYHNGLNNMEQIKPDDPRLVDLPQFLRKEITQVPSTLNSVIKGAALLMKEAQSLESDSDAYNAKMNEIETVMNGLARYEQFLTRDKSNSDLSSLPQFQDFEKMKKEGLKYGESGNYGVEFFANHFKAADDILKSHFQDTDLLENNGVYVELVSAKLNMYGSGPGKQISGSFELKVPGYEGSDTVKFDFSRIGPTDAGLSWESAVSNAMKQLVENKDLNKAISDQRDKKEDTDYKRQFIDFKERDRLEKRADKVEKGKSPYEVADYKAKTEADVTKEITDDFGNPAEYSIQEYEGKWVAIRIAARGDTVPSGDFGKVAGLVEVAEPVAASESTEQQEAAPADREAERAAMLERQAQQRAEDQELVDPFRTS